MIYSVQKEFGEKIEEIWNNSKRFTIDT